jgi:SpoVK/Ycf46/Vps4 family AAA+-type ATPase
MQSKKTMICTHVLNRGGKGMRSPVDTCRRERPGVLYRNQITSWVPGRNDEKCSQTES